MDSVVAAALRSWNLDPRTVVPLLITAGIYLRGWRELRQQMPDRFGIWRLVAFFGGLATIFVAIASPLDTFAGLLLQVHMVQHLLLMMVASPLILLGAPAIPMLRGLPQPVAKTGLGPFLAWPGLRRLGHFLAHPVVCWISFVAATWAWHVPALYELALHSPFWHHVEHTCFLITAMLFWWPVIQPWPSRPRWPRWAMIPYLLLADIQNTALSALFIFYERVIYPTYATVPRLGGISVLDDQAAAGAIMWVPGSVVFLVPVAWLIYQVLDSSQARRGVASRPAVVGRISRLILSMLIPAMALLGKVSPVRGHHSGVVQLMKQAGPFIVTVFTEPTPLTAGPVEISVMVQDRDSQRPVLDAQVKVLLQQRGGDALPISAEANRENGANRLMYTALLDLPNPGIRELHVTVQHGAVSFSVAGEVTVEPDRTAPLSYLALLPLAIGLVGLHRWLSRRRGHDYGRP